jgi:hypothetical protein
MSENKKKMYRCRHLETVGEQGCSKELISLDLKWKAWEGSRQKRKERREE